MKSGVYFNGSIVTMADGSKRNVCDLRPGDVIQIQDGKAARITDTIRGIEEIFLFEFEGDGVEAVNTEHADFAETAKGKARHR